MWLWVWGFIGKFRVYFDVVWLRIRCVKGKFGIYILFLRFRFVIREFRIYSWFFLRFRFIIRKFGIDFIIFLGDIVLGKFGIVSRFVKVVVILEEIWFRFYEGFKG